MVTRLPILKILSFLRKISMIDVHVAYTLLYRIWSIASGGATILLIPIFLTQTEQGIFYTFMAIIGLQIFFELGINHVLIQTSSHARASMDIEPSGSYVLTKACEGKITSLLSVAKKWYAIMATLLFIALSIGGYLFFAQYLSPQSQEWIGVWFMLVFATSINLALSGQLAICEGLGEVGNVSKLRLIQSVIGSIILWMLLFKGLGLWAILAIPIVNLLGTCYWLQKRKLGRSFNLEKYKKENNWVAVKYFYAKKIFPLQWRIAISWGSAYFIYNFITPVVFAMQGPIEAGKIGLALSIVNSITTLGMSWIYAKVPQFGVYIARDNRKDLNKLFDKNLLQAFVVTLFIISMFLLAFELIDSPIVKNRMPTAIVIFTLSITALINLIIHSMSAYIRAHGEEPMLLNSIISAILVGFGVYFSAMYGVIYVVLTCLAIASLITFPWCYVIFKRYRSAH
jgi:hypothetical protein